MIFHLLFVFLLLFSEAVFPSYSGQIVNAHSQFGCGDDLVEIKRVIKKSDISYTLISSTYIGCDNVSALDVQQKTLDLVNSLGGRAGMLISTKLYTNKDNRQNYTALLKESSRRYFEKSKGFAEIIVQHAVHKHPAFHGGGLKFNLNSPSIKKQIEIVKSTDTPVILHVELKDFKGDSDDIIRQLHQLAASNPGTDFVLMHMAQANIDQAKNLLENSNNIYFITSQADAIAIAGIRAQRRRGTLAQEGWINLFSDPPPEVPYKGWIYDYLKSMQWRKEWKSLIEQYPDRFIFALDNVFEHNWTKMSEPRTLLWRKALSMLAESEAKMIACSNAKRLWRLDIDCM